MPGLAAVDELRSITAGAHGSVGEASDAQMEAITAGSNGSLGEASVALVDITAGSNGSIPRGGLDYSFRRRVLDQEAS